MKLMKKNGGFTLVELIVVIAILAILAGIAVPAYSGYIKKAEKAGDLQLLGAINEAFAASCVASGGTVANVNSASLTMENKCVTGVATVSGTGIDADECKENFLMLFAGNTATQFKAIESLVFDTNLKAFVDPTTVTSLTVGYGGGQFTVSSGTISAMKDSSFYGEGMTSEKLLNQVDDVAAVAGVIGPIMNVTNTEDFAEVTLASLGYTDEQLAGMTAAQKGEALTEKAKAMAMANLGITKVDATNQDALAAEVKRLQNNALILYTAQSTSKMEAEDAKALLNGVNSTMIQNAMSGDMSDAEKAKGLNQAALAYGMYYAYVNSDACEDATLKKDEILATDVTTALDSNQDFKDYMASEQGTKDMEAYLQALGVVSSGAQNSSATEKLLNEGFASADLIGILEGAMGK